MRGMGAAARRVSGRRRQGHRLRHTGRHVLRDHGRDLCRDRQQRPGRRAGRLHLRERRRSVTPGITTTASAISPLRPLHRLHCRDCTAAATPAVRLRRRSSRPRCRSRTRLPAWIRRTCGRTSTQLTQIPRPSHHEEQVRDFLAQFGKDLGLETIVDDVGNVLIRKPASPGMEKRHGVILQAHMDMVAAAARQHPRLPHRPDRRLRGGRLGDGRRHNPGRGRRQRRRHRDGRFCNRRRCRSARSRRCSL